MNATLFLCLAGLAAVGATVCPCGQTTTAIDTAMASFNFTGACSIYNTAYQCNKACPDVQTSLTAYVGDVCVQGTSTVSPCGTELSSCVTDLMNANTAAADGQKTALCSDIATFFQCSNDALGRCSSKNSTATINQLVAAVSQLNMESGCDGACASQVGNCMAGVTKDVATPGGMNAQKFKDMCQKLNSATTCITPLKTTVCSGSQTKLTLAENMISKMAHRLSDLCDGSGNPTDCANGFISCGTPLQSITAQTACGVMSDYLTCTERLPCKYSLEDQIKAFEANITAVQNTQGCKIVGGCTDRIQTCVANAKKSIDAFTASGSSDLTTFCNMGKTIEQCFITVRNDPKCKIETLEAGDDEKKFFGMFSGQCGNATACSQSVEACKKDYRGLTTASTLADKCMKVGKAVHCIDAMLASDICVRVGQSSSTEDIALHKVYTTDCGNASSCETGLNDCYLPIASAGVPSMPDSDKKQACPIIKTAVKCMDKLRHQQICKIVQVNIKNGEQQINDLDKGLCGSGVSVQASVLLVAATLLAALWK